MNGMSNRKTRNMDKSFQGCLGGMVNLFDMSTSVPGNRLLTDKPRPNGSPLSRSRSDATTMSPVVDPIEEKEIVSELRRSSSCRKSNATPMKTLIAQEMSREVESTQNPPSLVAKLMGLDALPRQLSDSVVHKTHSRTYLNTPDYWEHDDMQTQQDTRQCQEQTEYKDVYEIWQQAENRGYKRDKSPQKGRHNEDSNEKKMAFIRQKFIEAKRLATDENLRQSTEFQDALEILSSNKDLFLKFLQEPNSMFSQQLYDLQAGPPPSETKRITVLRPCKMVNNSKFYGLGMKNEKQMKKSSQADQAIGWDRRNPGFSPPNWRLVDNPTQPTRIVVLKPSPVKPHDAKVMDSPFAPHRALNGEAFNREPDDDGARESREVAKEITRQIRENLSGHRRDETLISSVFSNGYTGDESSFHKSENEYALGNLSDCEAVTPTSRHSWDYINRQDSPYSSTSFSRASYSPESSVCREAKKRLSERWAMMSTNGFCQEQKHVRRSSSTLGEMLALSDTKNCVKTQEEASSGAEDPRGSTSYSDLNKHDKVDNSPRNLLRSKSLPVSSMMFQGKVTNEVSDHELSKTCTLVELEKSQSAKSSFKGKVSSLFFSRNKKVGKEKSVEETPKNHGVSSSNLVISSEGPSRHANDTGADQRLLPASEGTQSKIFSEDWIASGSKQRVVSSEAGLCVTNSAVPGNPNDNADQPSPISVLEPLFEDDGSSITSDSCYVKPDKHGTKLACHSNLIDKSPPIGSIARTLSWEDSSAETATSNSAVFQGTEEEERDRLLFIQTLLSTVGLEGNMQADSFFARWHSPTSPLDPSLREKYIDLEENNKMIPLHEATRRQRRSNRKLVFDCVNAALVDITGGYRGGAHNRLEGGSSAPLLVDEVWARVREWFSSEEVRSSVFGGECGDSNSLVVEGMVRKEVVGKGWVEDMKIERDNLGNEIESKLMEELLQEALVELADRV